MSPIIIGIVLVLVYAPLLWVRFTLWRYRHELEGIPGTGGELARHLVKKFSLDGVFIEAVPYTHLRAHETKAKLVCLLLLEKKKRLKRQA